MRGALVVCMLLLLLLLPHPVAAQSSYEELQTFSAVLNYVRLNYVDSISYRPLVRGAIEGMLRTLDPHSRYVAADEMTVLDALEGGTVAGVGVQLASMSDGIVVQAVGHNSPAENAGVLAGDRLVEIADTTTAGMTVAAAATRLAGPDGSRVSITVERGPRFEPRRTTLRIKRERFRWPSVGPIVIDGTTGYVRLHDFGTRASNDLREAVKTIRARGAGKLVIDLRGNPGGIVHEAVNAAAHFLPRNTVVFRTVGRKADTNVEYRTRQDPLTTDMPLVLLVDEGSASAAEALAASLQDHRRAIIAGQRTFGKALVQSAFPLPSGDVVWLTIAKVVSPAGRMLQRPFQQLTTEQYRAMPGAAGGGVAPDVVTPAEPDVASWWATAYEAGILAAVADSVAHSLTADQATRQRWVRTPELWQQTLAGPLRAHVAALLGKDIPASDITPRVLRLVAARVARIRWHEAAATELVYFNDPAVRAGIGAIR